MNFAPVGEVVIGVGQAPTQIVGMDGSNKPDWSKANGTQTTQVTPQPQSQQQNTPAVQTPVGVLARLAAKYGAPVTGQQQPQQVDPAVAGFNTLFSPTPVQVTTPQSQQTPNPQGAPNNSQTATQPTTNHWDVSGEHLGKHFGNLDVTQYIKPELMTSALGGNASDMMKILNTVVQMSAMTSYRQAMLDAKAGVEHSTSGLEGKLPDMFKDMSVNKSLGEDPILSAPLLQPVVQQVRNQIMSTYPQATEADVKEAVVEYLKTVGGFMGSPAQQSTQTQQTSAGPDWDKLLPG